VTFDGKVYKAGAAIQIENSWSETFPVPYIGLGAGGHISKNLWLRGHLK
jgi:hypothetical protein